MFFFQQTISILGRWTPWWTSASISRARPQCWIRWGIHKLQTIGFKTVHRFTNVYYFQVIGRWQHFSTPGRHGWRISWLDETWTYLSFNRVLFAIDLVTVLGNPGKTELMHISSLTPPKFRKFTHTMISSYSRPGSLDPLFSKPAFLCDWLAAVGRPFNSICRCSVLFRLCSGAWMSSNHLS